MAPKIVDKDEKRYRIAQAAAKVFGLKGFERTRMEDVAQEAGVGKGTLYEYYRDKEALLQDAFQVLMTSLMEELEPQSEQPDVAPLDRLVDMTRAMVRAMAQLDSVYRFFLEYMLHTSRTRDDYPFLGQMLEAYRDQVRALLDEGVRLGHVRSDVDTRAAAAAFLAWFDGAIFHWIVLPGTVSLEEMAEQFLEMTMRGLALPDSPDPGAKS